jgi:hypothetical protein
MPALAERLCGRALRPRTAGRARRLPGVPRVQWLRPSVSTLDDMCALARRMKQDGVPVVNLILKSGEATLAGGPDVRTPQELERFFSRLEGVLTYIVNGLGAVPVTFSEFRALYCGTIGNPSTE